LLPVAKLASTLTVSSINTEHLVLTHHSRLEEEGELGNGGFQRQLMLNVKLFGANFNILW